MTAFDPKQTLHPIVGRTGKSICFAFSCCQSRSAAVGQAQSKDLRPLYCYQLLQPSVQSSVFR